MKSPHPFLPLKSGVAAAAILLAQAALPLQAQQKHDHDHDHASPSQNNNEEDALKIPIDLRESLGIKLERIEIRSLKGAGSEAIAIPRGSVLTEDGKNFVLMQSETDDSLFTRVEVRLGEGTESYVDARGGVLPGDALISNAMDLLLAESEGQAPPSGKLADAAPVPPAPTTPYAAPTPAPEFRLPLDSRPQLEDESAEDEEAPVPAPAPSRRYRDETLTFRHYYEDWHSSHCPRGHDEDDFERDHFEDDHADYHHGRSSRTSRFICPNEHRFHDHYDHGYRSYHRR